MTTKQSEIRLTRRLERLADLIDDGSIVKDLEGYRINVTIDCHGTMAGYKYYYCSCQECRNANSERQR